MVGMVVSVVQANWKVSGASSPPTVTVAESWLLSSGTSCAAMDTVTEVVSRVSSVVLEVVPAALPAMSWMEAALTMLVTSSVLLVGFSMVPVK